MTSTPEIVKLNIGGTLFQTTKATLTRFDGFFRTILETDVPVTKDDFGAIFIDRDPTHFRLILNYMRDWNVKLPACEDKVEEISNEAQYYLLTGLVELCSKQSEVRQNTTPRSVDAVKMSAELGRIPHCQRCRLHGKISTHKEHKRVCPYRECPCSKCGVIAKREQLMASQIELRK
ncbi:unnamed protein product [Caenorhabditis brenneri]